MGKLRDREKEKATADTARKLSDYAMSLDLIGTITSADTEHEAIGRITELFRMLFAPHLVLYRRYFNGKPVELSSFPPLQSAAGDGMTGFTTAPPEVPALHEPYTVRADGFSMRIGSGEEVFGVIELRGVAFPAHLQHAINIALTASGVCALSISNARAFERLTEAERALTLEKDRFAVTLDSIGDGVVAVDTEERIVFLNTAAKFIVGAGFKSALASAEDSLTGKSVNEIFHFRREGLRAREYPVRKALRTMRAVRSDTPYILTCGGKASVIEIICAPIVSGDGALFGAVMVFSDISGRRMIEENIRKSRIEHERFMRHELKNIFIPIKGYAELILATDKGLFTERQTAFLRAMEESVEKAVILIDHLKHLQDIEAGVYHFEKTAVAITPMVEKAADEFLMLAGKHGVIIRISAKAKRDTVETDLTLLPGVFTNLIKNAVEHVSAPGIAKEKTVTIMIANAKDTVAVHINNRGEPLSPERIVTFFDKFNSDRTKKKDGTGLGTTYAYLVTKAHGGDITVTSNAVKGTTVSVILPLKKN